MANNYRRVFIENLYLQIPHLDRLGGERSAGNVAQIPLFVSYATIGINQHYVVGFHAPGCGHIFLSDYSWPIILNTKQFSFDGCRVDDFPI